MFKLEDASEYLYFLQHRLSFESKTGLTSNWDQSMIFMDGKIGCLLVRYKFFIKRFVPELCMGFVPSEHRVSLSGSFNLYSLKKVWPKDLTFEDDKAEILLVHPVKLVRKFARTYLYQKNKPILVR